RHAVRGACEWPIGNETASDLLESAISLTANRLVRTHPLGPDRMPISMWIRSLCLEELIRVSDHFQNDLMAVVDHLGTQGWEFAGRVEAWDRFLRTRSLNHPLRHETVELYAEALDQTIWEVGL